MPILTSSFYADPSIVMSKALDSGTIEYTIKIGKYNGDGEDGEYLEEDVSWSTTFTMTNDWSKVNYGPITYDSLGGYCGNYRWTWLYNKGTYRADIAGEYDTGGLFCNGELIDSFLPNNGQIVTSSPNPWSVYLYAAGDVFTVTNFAVSVTPLESKTKICHHIKPFPTAPVCSTDCYDLYASAAIEALFLQNGSLDHSTFEIKWFDNTNTEVKSQSVELQKYTGEDGYVYYTNNDEKLVINAPDDDWEVIVNSGPPSFLPLEYRFSGAYLFNEGRYCCMLENTSRASNPFGPIPDYKFFRAGTGNASCSRRVFHKGRFTVRLDGNV